MIYCICKCRLIVLLFSKLQYLGRLGFLVYSLAFTVNDFFYIMFLVFFRLSMFGFFLHD